MSLAQMGFAVVNFNYRLAPENKFPSSVEDTNSVFNWIEKNQNEYGFDCNNVFAVGDSAGANLLALYAAILTNTELKKKYDFELPSEINLKAVALNCGKYTVRNFDILIKALFDKKSKYKINDIEITSKITPDFPPSILMTCKGDFLCKEIYPIMNALEKQTVPFQCNFYGTKEKPLWHVFHVDCDMKEAQECNKTQVEFFKRFLQKD
jgi:acetyl esterase/lipase